MPPLERAAATLPHRRGALRRPSSTRLLDRAAELKAGRADGARREALAGADGRADLRAARRPGPGSPSRSASPSSAAHPLALRADELQLGRGESIADTARVLSALPARDRDPLGLARDGRRAGRRRRGAGDQRADPASPPLPGARRPADAARALRRASRGSSSPTSATATTSPARWRSSAASPASRCGSRRPPGYELEAGLAGARHPRPARGRRRRRRALRRRLGEHGRRGRGRAPARRPRPYQLDERAARARRRSARSPCTACPPTPARRSPRTSSTASARRSGTRPRTACTPRRRCSSCWSAEPATAAPRLRGPRPRGVTVSTPGFQPGSAGSTPAGATLTPPCSPRSTSARSPCRPSGSCSRSGSSPPACWSRERLQELGKPVDWAYEMVFAALVGGIVGARLDFLIQN